MVGPLDIWVCDRMTTSKGTLQQQLSESAD